MISPFINTNRENDNTDFENILSSEYFDIEHIQKLKIPKQRKTLSLFHLNTCGLIKNFDDLQHVLHFANKSFDFITRATTRIDRNIYSTNNLFLDIFFIELTPTESF